MSIYRFRDGSRLSIDAQTAGEVCETLASHGQLTAKHLVEVSKPEEAPLHNAFDWNDVTAAESWREHQARHIIGSLEIVVEKRDPVKAYFSIEQQEPKYKHVEAILSDPSEKERLLYMAKKELHTFEKKYSTLEELAKVFEEIHNLDVA